MYVLDDDDVLTTFLIYLPILYVYQGGHGVIQATPRSMPDYFRRLAIKITKDEFRYWGWFDGGKSLTLRGMVYGGKARWVEGKE